MNSQQWAVLGLGAMTWILLEFIKCFVLFLLDCLETYIKWFKGEINMWGEPTGRGQV